MRSLPFACAAVLLVPGTADAARLTFRPSPGSRHASVLQVGGRAAKVARLRFDVRIPDDSTVVSAALYVHSLLPCGREPVELRTAAGRAVARTSGCLRGRWVRLDATRLVRGSGKVAMALAGVGRERHRFSKPHLLVRFRVPDVVQPASPPDPPPSEPAAGAPRPPWRLVFDDEFDGPALDASKWTPAKWDGGSFYDPSNVLVENGLLRLRARSSGSSAMVQTHGKLDITYGRVEASIKVPRGQGFWPALWLRPSDTSKAYPEIDLVEMWMTDRPDDLFDETTAWITYHWPDAQGRNLQVYGRFPGPDNYTQGFHVFAMEWEPGEIRWYIDGVEKMRVDGPTVSTVPMFLIYSLQIGHADWIGADGDPNSATPFPSYLDADYVRVYQR